MPESAVKMAGRLITPPAGAKALYTGRSHTIWRPQVGMQTRFLSAPETDVFYGGEAGGGKSAALLMDASRYVNFPDYSAIIFRRTYTALEELLHRAVQLYTHPSIGAKFNSSKHRFTWPGGARIRFAHLQHLKDIYTHQGQDYDYIGWDELPQFPKLAFTYLFSRLRGTNRHIRRYMRATGNPDGEGLLWVKARYIDVLPPLTTRAFLTRGDYDVPVPLGTPESTTRRYVPCIRSENVALMANDPEYEARLNMLPEAQKNALKYGIWTTLDQPDQLVSGTWWQAALDGKNPFKDGAPALGCDYAHMGKDKTVIITGHGNRPETIEAWPKTRTTTVADLIVERLSKWGEQGWGGVDGVGPGVGVWDNLIAHHPKWAHRISPCNHKDPKFDEKWSTRYEFDNLRSQMWWKFRDDMEYGRIDLSHLQGMIVPDPDNPGEVKVIGGTDFLRALQEEILAHTYRVHNGKIIIISKEELRDAEKLGHSPDFADALVIWNWERDNHGFGRYVPDDMKSRQDYGGVDPDEEDQDGYRNPAI